MSWGVAGLASGLAGGLQMGQARKDRKAAIEMDRENMELRREELAARREYGVTGTPFFPGGEQWSGGGPGGGGGGYSGGAAKVDPMELKSYAMEKYGLPEAAVDGILMSAGDESGFDPGVNEAAPTVAGSRGGYGLFQHTGPRRVALERYAATHNRPPSDPYLQFDFAMQELDGPESAAKAALLKAKDAGEAAAAFTTNFLRPRADHLARRVAKYTSGQGWRPDRAKPKEKSVATASVSPPAGDTKLGWASIRRAMST